MTQATLTRRIKLRAAALELFRSRDPQVLICGPAGTGKSFAALQKVHMMCLLNPGMCALIVRQTLVSLTSTGVVTYKKHVAKDAIDNDLVTFFGGSLQEPPQFRYANGSKIMLGGMDNPTKIMSSEYDLIFVQEATELTVTAWEKLDTRLRNGVVSFQQLMADCNPDTPDHWLKVRCDEGRTRMFLARHTDNPALFDDQGVATPKGEAYLARLANLTGVRRLRLEKGIWAAAEGVIFDEYDPAVHVSYRKKLPRDWARVWGVDFGHTNPFVWQQWARDPDGRLWLEHEIYRTKRLVKDHAHQILSVVTTKEGKWKYPRPEAIVCDHDAEDRATLERELGMPTIAAKKDVHTGIEAAQLRFRLAGDGMPRLYLLADSLVDRDEEVAAAGLPLGLYGELPGYVWKPGADGKPIPDEPLKQNDHSCFVAGTKVQTDRGTRVIESIRPGERVWTRQGWCTVLTSGVTNSSARVFMVLLSDGTRVTGTGNHPIWIEEQGWVSLDALRYGDRVQSWQAWTPSDTKGSSFGAIPTHGEKLNVGTTFRELRIERRGGADFTKRFGLMHMVQFLRGARSITSILIHLTMIDQISFALRGQITRRSILRNGRSLALTCLRNVLRILSAFGPSRKSGMPPKTEGRGMPSADAVPGRGEAFGKRNAISAELATELVRSRVIDFAQTVASRLNVAHQALITKIGCADSVDRCLRSTSTPRLAPAPVLVLSVTEQSIREPVWNLTVETAHEYVANGILVHNCDTMRYVVAYHDLKARVRARWL